MPAVMRFADKQHSRNVLVYCLSYRCMTMYIHIECNGSVAGSPEEIHLQDSLRVLSKRSHRAFTCLHPLLQEESRRNEEEGHCSAGQVEHDFRKMKLINRFHMDENDKESHQQLAHVNGGIGDGSSFLMVNRGHGD